MSDTREKLEQMGFRILDAVRTELLLSDILRGNRRGLHTL